MSAAGGWTFDRVVDELGRAIVDGSLPADHVDTIEGMVARTGASRSVVREATRVLGALGMLSAGRRVGLRVLAEDHWDVLDPMLIRWRLAGSGRRRQIDELRALRRAVEPDAAAAAAQAVRDGKGECERIEGAADALRVAAADPDPAAFLQADRELHAAVLTLSGNSMFARLRAVIEEGLRDRALGERAHLLPDAHDVELHAALARAVIGGDPEGAAAAMREIIDRTAAGHP